MEDTLLKVLNIPIATSGNPLGEYTHINNIIGPAIGVGGTIYNLVTLKSTNFHHGGGDWGIEEGSGGGHTKLPRPGATCHDCTNSEQTP